jgi:DNA polymerase III subunit epsilon
MFRWFLKYKTQKFIEKNNVHQIIKKYSNLFINEESTKFTGDSEKYRYVVFDTETTGFNEKNDKILSIGAISIKCNTIHLSDTFYRELEFHRDQEKSDISVHGILPSQSKAGVDAEQAVLDFVEYIGNSILVGHHVDFDVDFLNLYLKKYVGIQLLNQVIDTARLSAYLFRMMNPNSHETPKTIYQLDSLCEQYNISSLDRHNSQGDSYITAQLFFHLTNRMKKLGKCTLKSWLV